MAAAPTDQELSALKLHAVEADSQGITRQRSGRGFTYKNSKGDRLTDKAQIERVKSLAIPPAWTNVWICPDPKGYVQATGRDAKGRKQSIYHPNWTAHREDSKYSRLTKVSRAIGRARKAVQRHLRRSGLTKDKVLASVVRLLDLSLIRVGTERYVTENGSFGLTTLRNRHVEVAGTRIVFRFQGKSGKGHEIKLVDRTLALLMKKLKDLKGSRLFQYIDDSGNLRPVNANDVNQYLQEIGGSDLTAKDFRTWRATRLAAEIARRKKPTTKKEINEIVAEVAQTLGNTPAIARKSYIAPGILELA